MKHLLNLDITTNYDIKDLLLPIGVLTILGLCVITNKVYNSYFLTSDSSIKNTKLKEIPLKNTTKSIELSELDKILENAPINEYSSYPIPLPRLEDNLKYPKELINIKYLGYYDNISLRSERFSTSILKKQESILAEVDKSLIPSLCNISNEEITKQILISRAESMGNLGILNLFSEDAYINSPILETKDVTKEKYEYLCNVEAYIKVSRNLRQQMINYNDSLKESHNFLFVNQKVFKESYPELCNDLSVTYLGSILDESQYYLLRHSGQAVNFAINSALLLI